MKKVLTTLQVLCAFIAYGAIGACDNGGDFGIAVRIICMCGIGIALFGVIKLLITALGGAIDEQRINIQSHNSRKFRNCQGVNNTF